MVLEGVAELKVRNVPEALRDAIKHLAVDDHCTINEMVIRLLQEAVKSRKGK
jgi:hypothetical protein